MVVLAQHPAFADWSAVIIGADMTSPVALYLPSSMEKIGPLNKLVILKGVFSQN